MHRIIFHLDADGFASGAIVATALIRQGIEEKDIEFLPINYGYALPIVDYENDQVYMVDFSLQPDDVMVDFAKKLGDRLVWLDHHASSVNLEEKYPDVFSDIKGLRMITWGDLNGDDDERKIEGCELTWKYYFEEEMPRFIELIGSWDTWRHATEESSDAPAMMFYLRSDDFSPKRNFWWWRTNINMSLDNPEAIESLLENDWLPTGNALRDYQASQDKGLMYSKAFEAKFAGHRAILVNQGGNSQMFKALYTTKKHDLMVTFQLVKGKYWTISLYTETPERVNCGELAKKLGEAGPIPSGGGHEAAAGLQCTWDYFWSLVQLSE